MSVQVVRLDRNRMCYEVIYPRSDDNDNTLTLKETSKILYRATAYNSTKGCGFEYRRVGIAAKNLAIVGPNNFHGLVQYFEQFDKDAKILLE